MRVSNASSCSCLLLTMPFRCCFVQNINHSVSHGKKDTEKIKKKRDWSPYSLFLTVEKFKSKEQLEWDKHLFEEPSPRGSAIANTFYLSQSLQNGVPNQAHRTPPKRRCQQKARTRRGIASSHRTSYPRSQTTPLLYLLLHPQLEEGEKMLLESKSKLAFCTRSN